jgi:hypothetical protein
VGDGVADENEVELKRVHRRQASFATTRPPRGAGASEPGPRRAP